MRQTRMLVTAVWLIYTLIFLALNFQARRIALPTRGGISVSEVLEGWTPGGVTTLLALWMALLLMVLGVWGRHWIRRGR